MSTDPKVSGGDALNPGGKPENESESTSTEAGRTDTVRYESYEKLLREKKQRDSELADLRKQIEAENAAKRAAEEERLRKSEDYKKLVTLREQEIENLRKALGEKDGELSGLKGSLQNSVKMRAFLDAVGGNVSQQYWGLIELDEVVIDPETGKVDETSVVKAARDFEKKYPLVLEKKNAGGLPNDAARGGATKLSYEEWLALPAKEQAKRLKDVI